MATARPRTAGLDALRRQSFRHYYEPFTPKVEEKEENEAYILQLQLPDFNQQQVRVKVEEGTRTVAVTGDRNMGNRWFRLEKTYPIPENCIIDKIDHKLEDGVLTITMPKETTGPGTAAAAEAAPETSEAPPPKEPEQSTPEKKREEISPENAALPETKTEIKGPEEVLPKDDSNPLKPTAEIQQEAIKEEAPTVAPPAVKGPETVRGDSGEAKTTADQTIGSPDQKATEKKEIENQTLEKRKESKTEEVGKNQEEPKIGTGAPSPIEGVRPAKLAGGYKFGRLQLPVTASLAAAVAIAVAAYLGYAYYGLLATE